MKVRQASREVGKVALSARRMSEDLFPNMFLNRQGTHTEHNKSMVSVRMEELQQVRGELETANSELAMLNEELTKLKVIRIPCHESRLPAMRVLPNAGQRPVGLLMRSPRQAQRDTTADVNQSLLRMLGGGGGEGFRSGMVG